MENKMKQSVECNDCLFLAHAADNDVFTIRCRENLCSIESPLVGYEKNYEKMWSFIQLLIQQGL